MWLDQDYRVSTPELTPGSISAGVQNRKARESAKAMTPLDTNIFTLEAKQSHFSLIVHKRRTNQ